MTPSLGEPETNIVTQREREPRQTEISRHDKCKQRLSVLRGWEGKA